MNKNICFKGDGTIETGKKIINALEKLGGKNMWNMNGQGQFVYLISKDNSIKSSIFGIPDGYELKDIHTYNPQLTAEEIENYKDWQVGDKIFLNTDVAEIIFRSGKFVAIERKQICVTYTCDELYNNGYRLLIEPQEKPIVENNKSIEILELENIQLKLENEILKEKCNNLFNILRESII